MAKAKPKAAAVKAKTAVLAAQMKAQAKKPNPFELKGAKGHFDTIGKRVSGKKQNVIKARQEAVNRRKKTLLVEYRQLRKANTFVDRRFGETDPELTETDKGLARLQAQRIKQERVKKKRGSKFTLSDADGGGDDGEGGGLTHLGRSLADDIRNLMDRPEFDDLDEGMVEDLVAQYHFGGGGADGEEGAGGEEGGAKGPDGKPKTRKQVMEEIIAKSRMYRAMKAKQREEDEASLEAVNAEFKELVRSAALSKLIKPKGADKGVKVKADNPEDAAYDVAARELAFESKGAAGDRTLTPEELQERERLRLEKLEKERLKRMRGGDDDEEDEEEGEGEEEDEDGAAARKKRRAQPSGDALGDDYDSEGGEDEEDDDEEGPDGEVDEEGLPAGMSDLDKRRMKAAAGNHPLQESFRAAAAALAKKFGVQAPKNPFVEEEDEDEEGEEEDEDDEGGEGEEDEEGEEDVSGSEGGEGEEDEGPSASGNGEDEGEEEEEEERLRDRREPAHPPSTSAQTKSQPKAAQGAAPADGKQQQKGRLEGPLDLPYTIPLPSSYNQFASLVNGRPAEDLHTAISRIRAFNAVALATDNKRKMQEFLGILVQHFAMMAGQSPIPSPSLDVLTRTLLDITPEVPFYAATVARARIGRMADQLATALAALGGATARTAAGVPAAAAAAATSPWPSPRVVLQLKLFSMLFPTSDRRHPVLTPAALLIGKYLNQCVVGRPHEAAVGLTLCGLMTHMAAPAHRTAPEVLVFLRDCLAAFLPPTAAGGGGDGGKAAKPATAKRKGGGPGADGSQQEPGSSSGQQQQQQQRQAVDSDAFVRFTPGLLALSGSESVAAAPPPPPPLDLYGVLGASSSDPWVRSDEFKLGLLRVALCGVRRSAALAAAGELVCFDQMFGPLRAVVEELGRIDPQLPTELRELRSSVLKQLTDAASACVAGRKPLVHPSRGRTAAPGAAAGVVPAAAVREFNPRFEDGFVAGRDYDPDRQRAEARRLKKALVKERRGAIRELRRDAVFMAEERDRETARVDAERMDSERKFYSELQRQEADLKSGGQGGMNPHLKKKGKK